jgi:hypothetical protein
MPAMGRPRTVPQEAFEKEFPRRKIAPEHWSIISTIPGIVEHIAVASHSLSLRSLASSLSIWTILTKLCQGGTSGHFLLL